MQAGYLAINAALHVLLCILCAWRPLAIAKNLGYGILSTVGASEYLVVYGGLQLGLAALFCDLRGRRRLLQPWCRFRFVSVSTHRVVPGIFGHRAVAGADHDFGRGMAGMGSASIAQRSVFSSTIECTPFTRPLARFEPSYRASLTTICSIARGSMKNTWTKSFAVGLVISIAGCATNPMNEPPERVLAQAAESQNRMQLVGGKYVECVLTYAEKERNTVQEPAPIADAAAKACHKLADQYGIYRNQTQVYQLVAIRNTLASDVVAQRATAIPSAEAYAEQFVAEQRPAIIEYVVRSRPAPSH